MRDLLAQVRAASAGGLYYAALFPALSLPDMCGALEAADGRANGQRYAAWFDRWVAHSYGGFLTGEDCYHFRCSLLHQGTTQHPSARYSRLLFLEPGGHGIVMHNNILNDALNIDVQIFCEDMVAGVEQWLPAAQQLPHFAANVQRFVTRYPGGLKPYIVGMPVIG
jgi:hypothetical protein